MKYYLQDDGINEESGRLTLKIKDDNYIFNNIRQDFSNLDDGVTIYSAITQEDGTETDEYIAQSFPNYTMLYTIVFDITSETYEITVISADNLEMRVSALEIMVNEILFGSLDEDLQLEPLNEDTTEETTDSETTDDTSNEDEEISIDPETLN